jgi:hypothetical protein
LTKPFSNKKNVNIGSNKTNKDIEILINSNFDPKKCDNNLFHDKKKN